MRALRTFHCLTPVSPLPLAHAVSLVVCFGGCFCFGLLFVLWVVFVCLVLQVSGGFSPFLRELDLDDRQCFTARSAALKKRGRVQAIGMETVPCTLLKPDWVQHSLRKPHGSQIQDERKS